MKVKQKKKIEKNKRRDNKKEQNKRIVKGMYREKENEDIIERKKIRKNGKVEIEIEGQ